jgi:triphosphoribosyl-dephospho-CoA synthase
MMAIIPVSVSMRQKSEKQIAQLVQIACVLEACAPKPGNVNRYHDFSDTSLEDFLLSAIAIGPAFENAGSSGVGQIILNAMADTRGWVQPNTNLGMILLFAPLVKATLGVSNVSEIRPNLKRILSSLTVEDARLAYVAIRSACPGGLGTVAQSDIAEDPSVTLLQAMELAQERDAVAREYVTGFAIVFERGLPAINSALSRGCIISDAIIHAYLTILSEVPDTLIARKKGMEASRMVSQLASDVLANGGVFTREGKKALAEMDRMLRADEHTLNPGTTADLTAASIFLALFNRSS